MRLPRSRTLIALMSALAATPGLTTAQGAVERPATHTVKKGDTLWDLAKQYLGDPFQWPQIYQINTAIIKDPHWIYPGQEFRIPGGTAAAAADATAAPARSAAPARNSSMTVFNPATRTTVTQSRESLLLSAARTAVRPGDFESSPFMWAVGGPQDGGTLDASAEPLGIPMTADMRPMQLREQVIITVPRGVEAVAGLKLLTYRMGPIVPGQGQVVIPTGVLQYLSAIDNQRAKAVVLRKYEDMFGGQRVTALDSMNTPVGVFPTRIEFGMSTSVVWVHNTPMLPSSGNKLIFAVGSASGLVAGDQLSLRTSGAGGAGGALADVELGVAQITRVTPWGASAVLLESRDGGIAAGMRAQVTAKMP